MKREACGAPWDLGLFAPSVARLTHLDTLALAAEHGYRCLEWRVQTAQSLAESPWGPARNALVFEQLGADAPRLAAHLRQAGLTTAGLQADLPLERLDVIPPLLAAAQALECRVLRVPTPTFDPAAGYLAQRDLFRQRLMAWFSAAERAGVRVCIENHFDTIAPSATLAADLLRDFDARLAGVIWDPANSAWEGSERLELALDQLQGRLAEVHVKNGFWRVEATKGWVFAWCGLDEGMVHWPTVLKLLAGAGYAGPLIIEDYRPLEPAVKLAQGRDYLCSIAAPPAS